MFQNQMILKKKHLSIDIRRVVNITALLLDKYELGVQVIYSIAYNLNKQDILDDEELIEESLFNFLGELIVKELIEKLTINNPVRELSIEKPIKELIEELIGHLSVEKVMEYIKYIYPKDETIQKIIISKAIRYKKLLVDLVK